jgi:hypothetical protein
MRAIVRNATSCIRITRQRKTRKSVPPHVANAIERARIRFAQMRQMRGTARNEKL